MLKGATGFLLRGTGFHIVIHAKKRTTDLEHSMRYRVHKRRGLHAILVSRMETSRMTSWHGRAAH